MIKHTASLILAVSLALSNAALAAGAKDYQVTGPVLEVTDTMIAVKKGKDRWETRERFQHERRRGRESRRQSHGALHHDRD